MINQDCWFSKPLNVFCCCTALIDGRWISHHTKIRKVTGWRPGEIIHNLKSRHRWPTDVEYRGPECIAHYRLRLRAEIACLEFPPSTCGLAMEGRG